MVKNEMYAVQGPGRYKDLGMKKNAVQRFKVFIL